ncbi:unnamed protein product [Ixodes persulcatus]
MFNNMYICIHIEIRKVPTFCWTKNCVSILYVFLNRALVELGFCFFEHKIHTTESINTCLVAFDISFLYFSNVKFT